MKKYFLVICLFFISSFSFAQWTNVINPQFTIHHESKLNSFVDANGVHIVYWRNGGIKYVRLNSAGDVLYYDKIIEPEGANCDFVNIVSVNNDQLYAIYKKNNTINVARSVNLGNNWTNNYNYWPMTNSGCDKMVAYNDGSAIHIAWTEFQSGSNYDRDAWYVQFRPNYSPYWSDLSNLTPGSSDFGFDPDITISPEKIHYTYFGEYSSPSWANPISRDKIKTAGWQNPMNISSIGVPAKYKKPVIANNKFNSILREVPCSYIMCNSYITHSDRPYNQGFWNDYEVLRETDLNYPMEVESTGDNKIHFIYFDKLDNAWEHRYLSGSTLSGSIAQIYLLGNPEHLLVSNSNDLYLLALGSSIIPTYPVFQKYDVAPLPPLNLNVTQSQNNHPYFTWTANKEPDRNLYRIYRNAGNGPQDIGQTTNTYFEDVTLSYCTATPPETCPENNYIYHVTAVDLGSNESVPSNSVKVKLVGAPEKASIYNPNADLPDRFILEQNYPNPFNPSTKITYSVAEDSKVLIKVYDMLGTEIAELVNEEKTSGIYETTFNASVLSSGIYVYRISAIKGEQIIYSESKRMILMK